MTKRAAAGLGTGGLPTRVALGSMPPPIKVTRLSVDQPLKERLGTLNSAALQALSKKEKDDVFSFADDVKSLVGSEGAMSMDSTASGGSGTSSSLSSSNETDRPDDGSGICMACDEHIGFGVKSKYCPVHKRSADCIARQAMKGLKVDPVTKAPIETPQSRAYKEVFGWRKKGQVSYAGDEGLAARVLVDFVSEFPDGGAKSTSKTKQRGPIDLTKYSHVQGTRVSNQEVVEKPLWDYELFETQMASMRRWKPERCKKEWEILKITSPKRGSNGPPESSLQLEIPAWMIGAEKSVSIVDNYEDKAMQIETKVVKMSKDNQEQMLAECRQGFNRSVDGAPSVSTMNPNLHRALGANALTQESSVAGVGGLDALMNAVGLAPPDSDDTSNSVPVQRLPHSSGAPAAGLAAPEHETVPAHVDLAHLRNVAKDGCSDEIAKATKKLQTQVTEAQKLLKEGDYLVNKAFYATLSERWGVTLLFLGYQPAKLEGGEGADDYDALPELIDFQKKFEEMKESDASGAEHLCPETLHTLMLRNALRRLESCPVESIDAVASYTEIVDAIQAISKMKSAGEIESTQIRCTGWSQMLIQLLKSIVTAGGDLGRANKKHKNEEMKKGKDIADKEQSNRLKKNEDDEADAKRMIAKVKATSNFSIDWTKHGHVEITVVPFL
jgi:hypothetical protein